MVAYSFKKQFVAPIRAGLSSVALSWDPYPKRQTIRAARKRHARPGDELQLYCGMRTRSCFLIGKARCISIEKIRLVIGANPPVIYLANGANYDYPTDDDFARADGFQNAEDMWIFWKREHPGVDDFRGVIIKWEPL